MEKLIFLDLETTGTDHTIHDVWQLGCIVDIFDRELEEIEIEMAPINPESFNIKALEVNDKTMEELKLLPDPGGQLTILKGKMGKYVSPYNTQDKFVMVGYNVKFDKDFLRSHFFKLGDKFFGSWFAHWVIDVQAYVETLFILKQLPGLKNCKLESVAPYFGIEHDAHDAMSDIKATRELFYRLVKPFIELEVNLKRGVFAPR